jgi:hypothetical protein
MSRRAIRAALVALMKTVAPFRSVSCKADFPDQLPDQPLCVIIFRNNEYPARVASGAPPKKTIHADIWIWDRPDDPPEEFGATMDDYVDTLDNVLGINVMGMPQTLGGLVQHIQIEGEVIPDYGHTTGQGVIKVPVKILIP